MKKKINDKNKILCPETLNELNSKRQKDYVIQLWMDMNQWIIQNRNKLQII